MTNLVDNCSAYSQNDKCSSCNSDYFLDTANNECKDTGISNCVSFSDLTICSECENGYIKQTETDDETTIVSCIAFTIDNCNIVNSKKEVCEECA